MAKDSGLAPKGARPGMTGERAGHANKNPGIAAGVS